MDAEITQYLKSSETRKTEDWNGITFHEAGLFGQDAVIVKSGVGKVFAAMVCERLIDVYGPRAVVFTGVAGALNSELDIGDVAIAVRETVPSGHKIALRTIRAGEAVIKYGSAIGLATEEIPAGAHVHTHNLASTRGRGDLARPQGGPQPRLAEPVDGGNGR